MQDGYVRSSLRLPACYNGGKICRRIVTESAGQETAKVRSSTRSEALYYVCPYVRRGRV